MFGEMNEELRGFDGFGQMIPGQNPALWDFVRRIWREGAQPRNPEIRQIWQQLRRQRRLGRRTWTRQFLRGVWQRGVQPRDPQIRQFAQQLRQWGIVPTPMGTSAFQTGTPHWYQQPPAWYTQPPPWYQMGTQPGFPMMPPFRPPFPGFPGQTIPGRMSLPQRALQTITSAVTSPFRAVTNLFR